MTYHQYDTTSYFVAKGGSNSPSRADNLPGLLVRLLDQLTAIGKTAAQIKKALNKGNLL
jgi:hypothetical protein